MIALPTAALLAVFIAVRLAALLILITALTALLLLTLSAAIVILPLILIAILILILIWFLRRHACAPHAQPRKIIKRRAKSSVIKALGSAISIAAGGAFVRRQFEPVLVMRFGGACFCGTIVGGPVLAPARMRAVIIWNRADRRIRSRRFIKR